MPILRYVYLIGLPIARLDEQRVVPSVEIPFEIVATSIGYQLYQ